MSRSEVAGSQDKCQEVMMRHLVNINSLEVETQSRRRSINTWSAPARLECKMQKRFANIFFATGREVRIVPNALHATAHCFPHA